MAACEKCWNDAYLMYEGRQAENYHRLLEERKDNPCTPGEQCGELHVRDESGNCRCGMEKAIRGVSQ
jgi:hypothetical protein